MRFLIQVVDNASVHVAEQNYTASIGAGLLIYVGISIQDIVDYKEKIAHFVSKIRSLQVFHVDGKLQGSLDSTNGEILLISNFTLYGENKKGNRFDFSDSAGFAQAQAVYDYMVEQLKSSFQNNVDTNTDIDSQTNSASPHSLVQTGIFGAHMDVSSTNAGPINFLWDI